MNMAGFSLEGDHYVKYYGKYKVRAYSVTKKAGKYVYPKYQARIPVAFRRTANGLEEIPVYKLGDTLEDLDHKLRYLFRLNGYEFITPRPGITIKEYAMEWFDREKPRWSKKTRSTYSGIIQNHIIPVLGDIEVCKLTDEQCDRFLLTYTERNEDSSAARIKVVLKGMMQSAFQEHLIHHNPVNTKLRKPIPKPRPFLQKRQILPFRSCAAQGKYGPLFDFMIFTGARPGEAIGATWDNYDEYNLSYLIDRQIQNGRIEKTKTRKERLVWAVDPEIKLLLERQRQFQEEQQKAAGPLWYNQYNLIFTNNHGGPLSYNSAEEEIRRIREELGLSDCFTMHCLRHTYATHTYESLDDFEAVQRNLGHDKRETSVIYIGTSEERIAEYHRRLNGLWHSRASSATPNKINRNAG